MARPPFGYRRRRDGRYEIDPDTGPVVRELFRRRGAGASTDELREWLMHELGVKTSRGRRYWQPATVEHLLKRRAYRGEIHWGSFVNFAAHEPVVDERIWQMAQAKGPGLPVQRSHEPALLRGILGCAGCQRLLTLSRADHGSSDERRLYVCRSRSGPRCAAPVLIVDSAVEPYVEEVFWHLLTRRRKRLGGSRIRRLEEQISRRERELVAYRDNAALPTRLGAQRFADGLSVRLRRVEAARRELADAQTATTAPSLPAPAALRKRWPSMSVRDRRAAIAEVVEAVFVARRGPLEKRLHVCVRGQAPSVPLYDPMHDKAEAAPFDSSAHQAARHGSNRAAGPIGELQQALEKFLADQTSWPPFSYFQRHGQAELHSEAERHGGTRHWASTLGVTYKPPNAQAACQRNGFEPS